MARLAERIKRSSLSASFLALFLLIGSCSKGPKTSADYSLVNTSVISGSISNLSSFSIASADEFRVYALNTEGVHTYATINSSGTFSLRVNSNSLYMIYVLQDTDGDGSYDNLIGTFDAIAGGSLDLVPIYSDDLSLGTFALPTSFDLIDLTSNPAIGRDMDGDAILDDVDNDINGNGFDDTNDLRRLDYDLDNIPNPIDLDRDGDTTNNPQDPNQLDSASTPLIYEQDSDGDGIEDIYDAEPTSLYGSLNIYYVTGRITYIPPGEALTAVAITTKGRFIRSVVDEYGYFNIPLRERDLFLLYFMSGNVVSNSQSTSDFRGIVDSIPGGSPNAISIGRSNLNLGNLTLPTSPLTRALNLNINIMANRDSDGDGIKDSVDPDKDGNGVTDATEILVLNFDADLFPNNLDTDDDNDSIIDGLDTDRDGDALPDPIDTDGDGVSDSDDIDYDNDGQFDGSNPTLVETPDLDVPIAGTGITFPLAQVQPSSIRINWGYARDNATVASLLEYRVVRQEAASNEIDTALEVSNLDPLSLPVGVEIVQDWTANINQADATGLDFPQDYYFAVVVRDEAGNLTLYTPQLQSTLDQTAPTASTVPTTNSPAPGPNDITVNWSAATDNVTLPGALEYKVVYSTSLTSIDTVSEANATPDVALDWTLATTSFNITGLDELTTYYIAVLVRDESGNMSLYPNVSNTTTDVTAPTIGDGPYFSDILDASATVGWDAATDNTTATASLQYKVVYSTTVGGTDIDDITEANSTLNIALDWTANVTSASVSSLTQSTEYYFAVLVRDLSGNMSLYAPQSFITVNSSAPDITGVISFSNQTDTTVDLAWDQATDDLTPTAALEYKVVKALTATAIDTIAEADAIVGADLVQDWIADIQTITASGLSSGIRYYFTVLVKDDAGNIAIYSPKSTVTIDVVAPTPGTGPTFSSTTTSQTSVSWTASTDNTTLPANLQYKLVRSSDPLLIDEASEANTTPSVDFVVVMDWTTATLNATSNGLTDNTTYYYAVFVRDAALNVNVYAPQSVTTADGTAPVVDSPTDDIVFSATAETETTVGWGEAADTITIDPTLLEYRLVKATSSTAIDTPAEVAAVTGADLIMDWTAGSLLSPMEFTATGLTGGTTYFFAVAVRDEAGNIAVYTPQSVTTDPPPNVAPTPGTVITTTNISDLRIDLTWGIASDDHTTPTSLQYKVVRGAAGATPDFSDATAAETNGILVKDWTTNLLTQSVTGLAASSSYKFAVLVRDAEGLKGVYTAQTFSTLAAMKYIYTSSGTINGKFTMTQADTICNTSLTGVLAGRTFKAIVSNGAAGTRRYNGTDWPLAANRGYKDRNGITIGITTASKIFNFPLDQAFDSTMTAATYTWTGLNADWTSSTTNCNGWTSNKNNTYGQVGSPISNSNTSIFISGSAGTKQCGKAQRLLCAEQ